MKPIPLAVTILALAAAVPILAQRGTLSDEPPRLTEAQLRATPRPVSLDEMVSGLRRQAPELVRGRGVPPPVAQDDPLKDPVTLSLNHMGWAARGWTAMFTGSDVASLTPNGVTVSEGWVGLALTVGAGDYIVRFDYEGEGSRVGLIHLTVTGNQPTMRCPIAVGTCTTIVTATPTAPNLVIRLRVPGGQLVTVKSISVVRSPV